MKSLLILGRQPALGLAELESLYGHQSVKPFGGQTVLLDIEPESVEFSRLGSSIKLAEVTHELANSSWPKIADYLQDNVLDFVGPESSSKITIGISVYGAKVHPGEINRTALALKKLIKSSGRSVRVVPNKSASLNSAQVIHNGLTKENGLEILAISHSNKTYIARTVAEQDIEAYTARDQQRPMRDAKVGMLPPKLAQVLVNLAAGRIEEKREKRKEKRILDPFCGTGVLVQEARLIGYVGYGSDVDPRMGEYYQQNMKWLDKNFSELPGWAWQLADATTAEWEETDWGNSMQDTKRIPLEIDIVACETYLGKPLSVLPPKQILDEIMAECEEIHRKFLMNIGSQIKPGTKLCLAIPAWKTKNGFLHLKTLDKLAELGYTRKKFVHVRDSGLIYHRPDQTVARELVVLERK